MTPQPRPLCSHEVSKSLNGLRHVQGGSTICLEFLTVIICDYISNSNFCDRSSYGTRFLSDFIV